MQIAEVGSLPRYLGMNSFLVFEALLSELQQKLPPHYGETTRICQYMRETCSELMSPLLYAVIHNIRMF